MLAYQEGAIKNKTNREIGSRGGGGGGVLCLWVGVESGGNGRGHEEGPDSAVDFQRCSSSNAPAGFISENRNQGLGGL